MSYFDMDGQPFDKYEHVHLLTLNFLMEPDETPERQDAKTFDIGALYAKDGETPAVRNRLSIIINKKRTDEAREVSDVLSYMRDLFNTVYIGPKVDISNGSSKSDEHDTAYTLRDEAYPPHAILNHIVRQASLIANSTRRGSANHVMMNAATEEQIARISGGIHVVGSEFLVNSIKITRNERLADGELFLVYAGSKMDVPFLYDESGPKVRVIENARPKLYGVRMVIVE